LLLLLLIPLVPWLWTLLLQVKRCIEFVVIYHGHYYCHSQQ